MEDQPQFPTIQRMNQGNEIILKLGVDGAFWIVDNDDYNSARFTREELKSLALELLEIADLTDPPLDVCPFRLHVTGESK